ncbi:hypothetical protein RHMOL_Rhmol05G0228300 [Rhododendron molle]|uniref:Uncharacterized protein n=1 Tax=Rhododendron molle TaxID=49168 RepID=A0ACC0NTJ8_RHOML|nr:hypothetical protein RHMOL_Rhmol05G0228300 [Rhododendron molle]
MVPRNLMEPDLRDPEEKMASFSPWKRGRPESWGRQNTGCTLRFFRPCLGMQMTNLCAARPGQLEKIIQKFPDMSEGVLVEEFCGVVWDKAGKSVKVVVIRKTSGARLKLKMKVDEINPENFYRWPLPEKRRVSVNRVRSCIMKIDFERQSNENGSERLSPQQRPAFFQRMKGVVILIKTKVKKPKAEPKGKIDKGGKGKLHQLADPDDNEVIYGTGFFFNSNGLIMTAGHVVLENWNSVRFRRVDDQNAQKVEVVYAKYDMDLAILKPKKEYHPDFATFNSEGPLSIGTELFSIGHPRELNFSYVVGEVAYEDNNHDIYKGFEDELLNLKGDLRVVQINNSWFIQSPSF